jgi:hypothetical protein
MTGPPKEKGTMPSSAARTFTDPDEYASAIPKATYEMTITQRGQFAAELVHIELHSLLLRHFACSAAIRMRRPRQSG